MSAPRADNALDWDVLRFPERMPLQLVVAQGYCVSNDVTP